MCSCQVLIQVGSNCIWLCHMDMIHDIMLYVTWRCITEIICMFHALRSNAGISLALFKWCLWNTTWSWWPLSTFTLWYRLSNLDRFARPQEFQGFFSPILNASQLSVHSFCCQVKVGDSNRISLLITFSLLVCIFQFKRYKMFGLVVIFFFCMTVRFVTYCHQQLLKGEGLICLIALVFATEAFSWTAWRRAL